MKYKEVRWEGGGAKSELAIRPYFISEIFGDESGFCMTYWSSSSHIRHLPPILPFLSPPRHPFPTLFLSAQKSQPHNAESVCGYFWVQFICSSEIATGIGLLGLTRRTTRAAGCSGGRRASGPRHDMLFSKNEAAHINIPPRWFKVRKIRVGGIFQVWPDSESYKGHWKVRQC